MNYDFSNDEILFFLQPYVKPDSLSERGKVVEDN